MPEKKWKVSELSAINNILSWLPARHTTYGEAISALVRGDYLSREGKTYLSVLGLFRTSSGSVILYNPAFGGNLDLGDLEMPTLDFTLLTLTGFSIFTHLQVRKYWPKWFYPQFDKGDGANPRVKLLDRERLKEEMGFRSNYLYLNNAKVSLDRSFAYAYTSYIVAPDHLLKAFPDGYHFLKDTVFAGKEYRGKDLYPRGGKAALRV